MEPTKKLTKFYSCEIKAVNENEKTVVAVVSTKKVDRDGDVILPDAFKARLKTYKDHPVFLSSHKYGSLLSQIGEAVKVSITDAGLEATFKYYVGQGNPEADWAWTLAKNGIAAFSVGFIGHEWEPITDKDSQFITGRTFTDVELLEISQVTVPSNRGALQLSRAAAEVETGIMEAVSKAFEEKKFEEQEQVVELCKCGVDKIRPILKERNLCTECKKSVSDDDLKTILEKAKAAEHGAVEHYSETILGAGGKSSNPTPDEILSAIRQGFAPVKN